MKTHLLQQEQYIDAPLDVVFPFFSRPENLERLTPDFMGMTVLTPQPIPMHVGAIIDYVVSVNGLPMRWTTCISEYEPPHRFVDVQLKGPYSFWHHTHTFETDGEGTRIRDAVRYVVPFGPLGIGRLTKRATRSLVKRLCDVVIPKVGLVHRREQRSGRVRLAISRIREGQRGVRAGRRTKIFSRRLQELDRARGLARLLDVGDSKVERIERPQLFSFFHSKQQRTGALGIPGENERVRLRTEKIGLVRVAALPRGLGEGVV